MSEFDTTLEAFLQDMDDSEKQSRFFDLFLNTTLYLPVHDEKSDAQADESGKAPLVLSAEGRDFLMLFDTEERLYAWAQREVPIVAVPGHVLALNTPAGIHWMLNYGSEPCKAFSPEEIAWLERAVKFSKAQANRP